MNLIKDTISTLYHMKRNNIFVILMCLILILTIILTIPYLSFAQTTQADQTVRVGYFQLDGFNDMSEDGVFSGYGHEFLMEILKYADWDYELRHSTVDPKTGKERRLTYEECLVLLENGEIDFMLNVNKDKDNSERFIFPSFFCGESYGILTTDSKNTALVKENIESFNGITIGVLAGSDSKQEIIDYITANKISDVEVKEFTTVEEIRKEVFETKNVDAIYTRSMRSTENESIIMRINPMPVFVAVNKEQKAICSKLESALESIMVNSPEFAGELYKKYYTGTEKQGLILTEEEKEYILNNPIVKVGVDPSYIPIEYYDFKADKISGITGDLLDRISKDTGLQFEGILSSSYGDTIRSINTENMQLIASFGVNYLWAAKQNVKMTSSYMSVPISVITKDSVKDYTDPNLKVAVLDNYYLTEKVKTSVDYKSFIYFDSVEECVNAVNRGEADITYVPTYSADYFGSHSYYTRIRTYAVPELNYEISFATTALADPMLYNIMNKAVNSISQADLDNILFNNILFNNQNESIVEYIYKFPLAIILTISLFWIMVAVLGMNFLRMRKKAETDRILSHEKIHIALAQTELCIWDYELDRRCIVRSIETANWFANDEIIYDVPESMIVSGVVHPEDAEMFRVMFDKIFKHEKSASGLFRIRGDLNDPETNTYKWIEVKLTNVFEKDGKPIKAIGLSEDVTKKINAEMQLKDKAMKDPLTNLLNRNTFKTYVEEFLENYHDRNYVSALIIIDTDDFKRANDTYGHIYGDQVLISIAKELHIRFRRGDFVGRLGGDEFVIFIRDAESYEDVEEKAKMLCRHLIFEKDDLITTCSAGIAIVSNNCTNYDELYNLADKAMYKAKQQGKNTYVIYDQNIDY